MEDLECGSLSFLLHFCYWVTLSQHFYEWFYKSFEPCLSCSFFLFAAEYWGACLRGDMLKNCESCSAPAWVAFHCGPGSGKAGKREVWWWPPISLVSWCHAAGGDKTRFWRKVTAGERKGVMAAVREPGDDKEVRRPAEFRVACLRGAWGGAARCRMLLASWGG